MKLTINVSEAAISRALTTACILSLAPVILILLSADAIGAVDKAYGVYVAFMALFSLVAIVDP